MSLIATVKSMLRSADLNVLSDFYNSEVNTVFKDNKYVNDQTLYFLSELINNGISWKFEDGYGGEGKGEEYWSVYSFTKNEETVYIKFDGYYQSYSGSEYDDFYQVEPKHVMVTRYQKV
jgi:hypothetical protein